MKNLIKTTLVVLLLGVTAHSFSQKRTTTTKKTSQKKQIAQHSKKVNRSNVVYKTRKTKLTTVRTLSKPKTIKHNGRKIYYDNNKFYSLNGGRYVPTIPTIGFRVSKLPVGYKTVHFNNRRYFSQNGVFFIFNNSNYEVVNPEIGTIVYELPEDVERVTIDGNKYYEFNNVLYEKVQVNGTRAYEVVGMISL